MKTKIKHRKIRIIAGKYKGRRLSVPDCEGLRPCPDRVRETVFNWLQFELTGATVLDAFAGSGAMGLEALSRGAGKVIFADKNPTAIARIRSVLTQWQEKNGTAYQTDALKLSPACAGYDVIFLDPPFAAHLQQKALCYFANAHMLKPNGKIYVEMPYKHEQLMLASGFYWDKQSKAGNVYFGLICQSGSLQEEK